MAKGFTVKAKTPKPSESAQEWDYAEGKGNGKRQSPLSFVYQVEEYLIRISKTLYNFVLI